MFNNPVTHAHGVEATLPILADRLPEEANVTMRLYGRVVDVKAALGHWGIKDQWLQANGNLHDECAVDGVLELRK